MPKSVKNQYTQKQFEKDLNQLELLVKNNSKKGGVLSGNNENKKKSESESESDSESEYESESESHEEYESHKETSREESNTTSGGNKKRVKKLGGKKGKELYDGTYRHFKMVEVDGKPVKTNARADIKEHQSPLNAAKKLLTSMVKKEKLSDNAKSKLSVIFYIQETNRESKSKIYGPYIGKYHKYTPSEAAKASADKGKVFFKFKPMVRLYKGSSKKEQKGGKKM
jgi:hypothetical protein